jgi:hypothetical protein
MKKRKPRPGSLSMRIQNQLAGVKEPSLHPAQQALPWWMQQEIVKTNRAMATYSVTALRAARAKAEELAGVVRTDAFNDWFRRCVVDAKEPSEWTQARVLYESYIRHAKTYGEKRWQRELSIQEAATETQWGRMMATLRPKKRRTNGYFYPLQCKRNA